MEFSAAEIQAIGYAFQSGFSLVVSLSVVGIAVSAILSLIKK